LNTYSNVENVDTDTTHVLFASNTLLGGPLEGSDARILDFVEVLNSLGDIDKQVGASGIGTEAPDLSGIGDIPSIVVGEDTGPDLVIFTGVDGTVLDGFGEFFIDGHGLDEDTVVLVLRLGQGDDAGLGLDGLTVGNDGVGDLKGDTSVVLLEILGPRVSDPAT
jgi:hypothetical protein